METKENQWRYLHTLALHEMNSQERVACSTLDNLSARLDELLKVCDRTDRVARRCRAQRFREHIVRVATKPVQQAAAHLSEARYVSSGSEVVEAQDHAVRVRGNAAEVVSEITKFRQQAQRFRNVAQDVGVMQLTSLAEVLEKLAVTVGAEAGVVMDAAIQVNHAGDSAELSRSKVLTDMVQRQQSVSLPRDANS